MRALAPAAPVRVYLDGQIAPRARVWSLKWRDIIGASPNTAALSFEKQAPSVGQAIQVVYEDASPGTVLFAGEIQAVTLSYDAGRMDLPRWDAALIDLSYAFNAQRPFGRWADESATAVALGLAAFAPGFSTAGIASSPDLPRITFSADGGQDLLSCFASVAALIGGQAKVDYAGVIRLDTAPLFAPPDPIDRAHPPLNEPPIGFSDDLSQVRTRIYGRGLQTTVPTDLAAA